MENEPYGVYLLLVPYAQGKAHGDQHGGVEGVSRPQLVR